MVIVVSTTGKFSISKEPSGPVVADRSPALTVAFAMPPFMPTTLPLTVMLRICAEAVICLLIVREESAAASCAAVRCSVPCA